MEAKNSLEELISVIVPVYRNTQGLARTIASLERLSDPNFEIIIVDDGSPIPTELPKNALHCQLVKLAANKGPGIARNEGVRQAKGNILAFTDSDCVVYPHWLSQIREAMKDPSVDAIAGTFARDNQPNAIMMLRNLESTFYHLHERLKVNCFTSANFAIRREVFETAGGFPSMRIGEDLILGYKMSKQNKQILWLPDLKVSQHFRSTLKAYFYQQFQWSQAVLLSYILYPEICFLKWPVRRGSLNIQLVFFSGCIFIAPFLALAGAKYIFILTASLLVSLILLNIAFLRDTLKTETFYTTLKLFLLAGIWRNFAWFSALVTVALRHPWTFIRGSFALLLYKIPWKTRIKLFIKS